MMVCKPMGSLPIPEPPPCSSEQLAKQKIHDTESLTEQKKTTRFQRYFVTGLNEKQLRSHRPQTQLRSHRP